MAHDHFVARTYLKHFGDSADSGMLHAYRKSDGAQFPCWPRDACREWDGDLNPIWLKTPLETRLKDIDAMIATLQRLAKTKKRRRGISTSLADTVALSRNNNRPRKKGR